MTKYSVTGGPAAAALEARSKSTARSMAILVALALSAVVLTGCLMPKQGFVDYRPVEVSQNHPITVEQGEARLEIQVPPRSKKLSREDRARVAQFASEHRSEGHGPLVVARPRGGRNEISAAGTVASVQRVLRRSGVPGNTVQYRAYRVEQASAPAPVILTFERYQARVEECGRWPKNVANTYDNRPYANFGCASQANLAAMVVNPKDFVTPRTMTPADAIRRDNVYDAYRKGDATQSERTKDDSGKVSEQKVGE